MENYAEKMFNLSEKEITGILIECFQIKLGLKYDLSANEITSMVKDILTYQGSMFVTEFKEAFSMFAAQELKVDRYTSAKVTSFFIGALTKAYKEKKYGPRENTTSIKYSSYLTEEEHYNLFIKFIHAYHCMPGNPNWIAICNHCVFKKYIVGGDGKLIEKYTIKNERIARQYVIEFTEANYGKLLTHVFNHTPAPGTLKGLGTRLAETLRH